MKRRSAWALTTIVLLVAGGAACSGTTEASGSPKLKVVTAFYPIELAARRVGGEFVDVSNLTPPGGEPHDLELKPSDVASIRRADLVLYFDKGFQPAVDDAIETISDKSKAVDLLSGMPLKSPAGENEEKLTIDPHVWLSIEKYRAQLASCARHEIFTSHAAFAYMAERYGLRQIPIAGLTPEAEPSSKRLQEISRQASQLHATTIFFETLVSPRISQAVARIVGTKTAVLDPIEGLPPGKGSGVDYFSIMRSDLRDLVEALDCKS